MGFDEYKFSEKVSVKLRRLSKQEQFFAWICAVRALPFFQEEGFNYWRAQRPTLWLALLRALDAAAIGEKNAVSRSMLDSFRGVPRKQERVTQAVLSAYNGDAVTCAMRAAGAANAYYKFNIERIILRDLDTLQAGKTTFHHDTSIYGDIWLNFLQALRAIDCGYWADWYEALFAKGFILEDEDREEIKLRLNLPGEFIEQGAAAVAREVMRIKKLGAAKFNETRVLILGEKGAGKTSLALRLQDPLSGMPKMDASTEGVDVIDWTISTAPNQPDSDINVHIWDFAGHVITHAAHRCFMSERCLYILLINGRTEGDNRSEYWLEQIRNYGGNSPVLVLVNTWDDNYVDLQEETLKNAFPTILGFHRVNISRGGPGLEDFRQVVMNQLRNNPLWKDLKVSDPINKVKEDLRAEFNRGNEFIQRVKFDEIAQQHNIDPSQREGLLKDLRALGICLWYGEGKMAQFDTMVLNPSWISHGIYRLINWGMNNKKHILSVSDFHHVFTGNGAERYPKEKAGFLFQLMEIYQLAFFKTQQRVFVPLLLPADRPKPEYLPHFPIGEGLRMVYQADRALPPYTVTRLAVLHSEELDQQNSWRFGALLRWNDTTALVEESERALTVSVIGMRCTDYITRLRESLNSIFYDYKNSQPELRYEVLLPDELRQIGYRYEEKPLMISEKKMESHVRNNQLYWDEQIEQLINLMPYALKYGVTINVNVIHGNVGSVTGTASSQTTNNINIAFNNCSVNLQGDLKTLAAGFAKKGFADDVEFLEEVVSDLEEAEKEVPVDVKADSTKMKSAQKSLRKKGLLNRLESLYDELSDENSDLRKKADKIRGGVEILQKAGSHYNAVAQWFALPQVPDILLGKYGKAK